MTVHFTPPAVLIDGKVDRRLAFLARAAARFQLVEAGEMGVDEAIAGLHCPHCVDELVSRWEERDFPHRSRSKPRPKQRVAQSTLDAIICTVRQRGIAALKEPKNLDRLARCSAEQRANLNKRIEKIISDRKHLT